MRCLGPKHFLLAWVSFFVPLAIFLFRADLGIGIAICSVLFAAVGAALLTMFLHRMAVLWLKDRAP